MAGVSIGDHDPMVFEGGGQASLGIWVECECGWIGPGFYSRENAIESHRRHEAAAAPLPSGSAD